MSQEAGISRKEKRAQRDAERHKKGKKRKHAETDAQDGDVLAKQGTADIAEQQQSAQPHVAKSKKRKANEDAGGGVTTVEDGTPAADQPTSKKRKKTSGDAAADQHEAPSTADRPQKATKSRFIVFVGNLPFKTTDDSLRTHFKKLEPFTLRHRTDPETKKSKGFAFLEFENYDRMKTCLKLYHHTMFDPADPTVSENLTHEDTGKRGKKSTARKINVELTAGGGGKTEGRQAKIKAKNIKLEEERKRRAETERKERMRKEKKTGIKGDQIENGASAEDAGGSHGIHPSRLAMMNT